MDMDLLWGDNNVQELQAGDSYTTLNIPKAHNDTLRDGKFYCM